MNSKPEAYHALPGVAALLRTAPDLAAAKGHGRAVAALRAALDSARDAIRRGESVQTAEQIITVARSTLAQKCGTRPVINATGVIIHTNLGRAPLSEAAREALLKAAATYTDLEYDLESGARGKRETYLESVLAEVTGAEAALAVNNNAAATLLMLSATAQGREVILSRAHLVEIGGGFRIPDVMAQSGAHLVECGTTNRTRIADFERAITEQTALLLRVHVSNFKMIGFIEQPTLEEVAALSHARGLLAADDLGSGALLDTAAFGMAHEPTVQESLRAGFDLACFSADKLLGGPQAGIIVGKREPLDRIKRHPLARAVRIDKLCLAALTATLEHYQYGEALTHIPVWRMIATDAERLRVVAESWREQVGGAVVPVLSTVGGGSLPGETLPGYALALTVPTPDYFLAKLRKCDPPVIARIADGRVLLDPRTVFESQFADVVNALKACLSEGSGLIDPSLNP